MPKALFIVGDPNALNPSEVGAKARLQSLGFEVPVVDDSASVASDANNKTLILISATVGSGNVNTKFRNAAVPILNWEPALEDDLLASAAAGVTVANQTDITIVDAAHPLAAGLTAGLQTVMNPPQSVNYVDLAPNTNATVVATMGDGTGFPVIFVYTNGARMFDDPTTGTPFFAPATRVGFFLNNDTFANLNTNGLALFDAAVRFTAGLAATTPPRLTISRQGNNVVISWDPPTGTLESADVVTGPYNAVTPQPANPATIPVAPGNKFFRVRQ